MRAVIQRVSHASVSIHGNVYGTVGKGILVLLGIEHADGPEDVLWLASKIAGLRIFPDAEGKMNLSVNEAEGGCLLISQFTLHAATAKGNRPSFIRAARPEQAIPLYEQFAAQMKTLCAHGVQTGVFGADMQVELLNDGPVTILIDSRMRE